MKQILQEDLLILQSRIADLERQLFELGEEFAEAVSQSSETWHDNAPFDAARDKQSLLQAEILLLRASQQESTAYKRKRHKRIQPGSRVVLENGMKLLIGGVWVGREEADGYRVVSSQTPIALALLDKKLGDEVVLPKESTKVVDIA